MGTAMAEFARGPGNGAKCSGANCKENGSSNTSCTRTESLSVFAVFLLNIFLKCYPFLMRTISALTVGLTLFSPWDSVKPLLITG